MSRSPIQPSANPMWGGHYASGPAEAFVAINPSLAYDVRLYRHDIRGSLAHAAMLAATGIMTQQEAAAITKGLQQIEQELDAGTLPLKSELEDIHMNIEARLAELIGATAGKLHTARSRNDQVATAFRLFVRDAIDCVDNETKQLVTSLLNRADEYAQTLMPGFTHSQPAQPVSFGHHLHAYAAMLLRDRRRLRDALTGLNECPLGSAALAGTSFPIDRQMTAEALGFTRPTANSLDSVADRDFVLEPLATFAICAMHLSRLAEELVMWCSPLIGFITLPESFTSGSSIMPQKRNPDAAELIRGKMARIAGAFDRLLMVMKGLPLAYNKDTQEDKEPFFDAFDQLRLCLQAMRGMVDTLEAQPHRMLAAANLGHSTATDMADWLVRTHRIPFREAHHITGRAVALAESRGCQLAELTLADLQAIDPRFDNTLFQVLSIEASVHSRTSAGGTAPIRVHEAIAQSRKENDA